MPVCLECNAQINRHQLDSLTCTKCNGLLHSACANINVSKKDFDRIKKGNTPFVCNFCRRDKFSSAICKEGDSSIMQTQSQLADKSAESVTSNTFMNDILVAVEKGQHKAFSDFQDKMVEMFNSFKIEQCKFNNDITSKITSLNDRIEENSNKICAIEVDSNTCSRSLLDVKTELEIAKTEIRYLKHSVNVHEQSKYLSYLEIHGLPIKPNEDLKLVTTDIAKALDVQIENDNIISIYRIRKPDITPSTNQFPPIIAVQFSTQTIRDKFIQQRKIHKNFSTVDIKWPENERHSIYIRETLTALNRRIYSAALALRRSNKIKYLWISGGKIFGRKADGERRFQLTSIEDVNSIN